MAEEAVVKNGDENVTLSVRKAQMFVEAPKANDAVELLKKAFGFEEVSRVSQQKMNANQESVLVISAEILLGKTTLIVSHLSYENETAVKSSGLLFCLGTNDVDAVVEKAVKAGGSVSKSEADGLFCGGGHVEKVKDPYGNVWMICSPPAPAAKKEREVQEGDNVLGRVQVGDVDNTCWYVWEKWSFGLTILVVLTVMHSMSSLASAVQSVVEETFQ